MVRVGIGGWTYPPWRGAFYPAGLAHAAELGFASQALTAIEINATFHRTQAPASFVKWRDATPGDFVFTAKAPRTATYRRELDGAGPSVERFLDSGLLALGAKLGPILWQLSPRLPFDVAQAERFLALLPAERDGVRLRHAIEATHPSFDDSRFDDLLRRHRVARVIVEVAGVEVAGVEAAGVEAAGAEGSGAEGSGAEGSGAGAAGAPPGGDAMTADFAYARLKRNSVQFDDGYCPEALRDWAARFTAWDRELAGGCFVFFIGGDKQRAPLAAVRLRALLEGPQGPRLLEDRLAES